MLLQSLFASIMPSWSPSSWSSSPSSCSSSSSSSFDQTDAFVCLPPLLLAGTQSNQQSNSIDAKFLFYSHDVDRDSEDAAIMEDLSKHLPSMQSEHLCKSLDQDRPRKDWQRLLSHPNVFGFFNLSRSNSVLIFPACRKENSLHTVALCTALVAKSGSIASSKCSRIRIGAEKISKEQNTRRTLTFKYLQVPPHNTIRKIRFRIDWRGWGRCGVFGFLLTKREVEEDEEERGMPPALSTIQKVSGWPPS